jgi:chemotaxis protein methyltransferase CheR
VNVGRAEALRFREILARLLGFHLDEDRIPWLQRLLADRAAAAGCDGAEAYLRRLDCEGLADAEVQALAEAVTVTETYFLRDADQLRAFGQVALPDRMSARRAMRTIRILSAGCASGEEAYSLAMTTRSAIAEPHWSVSILGIDVNPRALEKAAAGRYSWWSLRETPDDVRERHFRPVGSAGREVELQPDARAGVSFAFRNLVQDDVSFWRPDAFDVVFCRNVIMYFTPEVMRAVVARIHRSLSPGGFLFLGHAETLRGVSQDFHLRHTHGAFYYQHREGGEAKAASPPMASTPPPHALVAPAPVAVADDVSWSDAIERSSTRIAELARSMPASSNGTRPPAPPDLRPAVELLRRERFGEAMDLLGALPASSQDDLDAQLLRAVLLTNGNRLNEAEQACTRILAADELNAGAHYLMALCREHAGDRQGAIEHDQMATYIDAGFAMPRLHVGLLARRSGALEQARIELSRALDLLAREDGSRILLFGGGFSRDALAALCRAELEASGERAS